MAVRAVAFSSIHIGVFFATPLKFHLGVLDRILRGTSDFDFDDLLSISPFIRALIPDFAPPFFC